ncbi:hypothetical protein RugamoR64_03090 [Duganella rhizosphaerae]
MRAVTERTIWSISVSPDSRDSSPTIVPVFAAFDGATATDVTAGPGAAAALAAARASAAASASATASAAADAAAPKSEVRERVLVILPSQYEKLCVQVYWHCTGFVT